MRSASGLQPMLTARPVNPPPCRRCRLKTSMIRLILLLFRQTRNRHPSTPVPVSSSGMTWDQSFPAPAGRLSSRSGLTTLTVCSPAPAPAPKIPVILSVPITVRIMFTTRTGVRLMMTMIRSRSTSRAREKSTVRSGATAIMTAGRTMTRVNRATRTCQSRFMPVCSPITSPLKPVLPTTRPASPLLRAITGPLSPLPALIPMGIMNFWGWMTVIILSKSMIPTEPFPRQPEVILRLMAAPRRLNRMMTRARRAGTPMRRLRERTTIPGVPGARNSKAIRVKSIF